MKPTKLIAVMGIVLSLVAISGVGLVWQQAWADTSAEPVTSPAQALTVFGCLSGGQFQPVLDAFTTLTGFSAQYEETCDQNRIRDCKTNNDCPDVAIVTQPGLLLTELGKAGTLVDLSPFVNSTLLNANYASTWIDLGKVDGTLYGVWFNANNKSLVWFDPGEFAAHGWTTPTTWAEMMTLSETISNTTGTPPWSIGSESGAATGWPLTDWFENILLRGAGPGVYDALTAHDIAWTDPAVLSAMTYFGQLFGTDEYQLGGKSGTLNTSFGDAIYPPFEQPPEAYLHAQGGFAQSFIQGQFPTQIAGTDYAVFPFPDIDPAYANAVMGQGDIAMVFRDTTETRSLINFLITTDAAEIWIAHGGSSPNRSVDTSLYPDPNTRAAAEHLTNADIFRVDLSDQLPSDLMVHMWSEMDDLVQAAPDQEAMEEVLARIEFRASHRFRIHLPLIVRSLN